MRPSLLLVIASLTAACAADGPTDDLARSSAASGLQAAGLTASCGGVRFSQLPPDTSTFTPFESFDELDLARLEGEAPFFEEFVDGYDWFVVEEGESSRRLFGQPMQREDRGPPYAYASLELRDGRWTPAGWGQCYIALEAEGWGNASFVVDPSMPPDPDADRISVLATERACAGGEAPIGRDVRAVILEENEDAVSVVILVEPEGGDCPSNPAFGFEVELGSPLGDREILDASLYPPEVRWPRGRNVRDDERAGSSWEFVDD